MPNKGRPIEHGSARQARAKREKAQAAADMPARMKHVHSLTERIAGELLDANHVTKPAEVELVHAIVRFVITRLVPASLPVELASTSDEIRQRFVAEGHAPPGDYSVYEEGK